MADPYVPRDFNKDFKSGFGRGFGDFLREEAQRRRSGINQAFGRDSNIVRRLKNVAAYLVRKRDAGIDSAENNALIQIIQNPRRNSSRKLAQFSALLNKQQLRRTLQAKQRRKATRKRVEAAVQKQKLITGARFTQDGVIYQRLPDGGFIRVGFQKGQAGTAAQRIRSTRLAAQRRIVKKVKADKRITAQDLFESIAGERKVRFTPKNVALLRNRIREDERARKILLSQEKRLFEAAQTKAAKKQLEKIIAESKAFEQRKKVATAPRLTGPSRELARREVQKQRVTTPVKIINFIESEADSLRRKNTKWTRAASNYLDKLAKNATPEYANARRDLFGRATNLQPYVVNLVRDVAKAVPALIDTAGRIAGTSVFIWAQAAKGNRKAALQFMKEQNAISTRAAISAANDAIRDPTTYILALTGPLGKLGKFSKKPTVKTTKIPKVGTRTTPNIVWINQKTKTIRYSDSTGRVFRGARGAYNPKTLTKALNKIYKGKKIIPKGEVKPFVTPVAKLTKADKAARTLGFQNAAEKTKWLKLSKQAKTSKLALKKFKAFEKQIIKRFNEKQRGLPNLRAQKKLLEQTKLAIKRAEQIRIKPAPRRKLAKSKLAKERAAKAKAKRKPQEKSLIVKRKEKIILQKTKLVELPKTTTISPKEIAENLIKKGKEVAYVQTPNSQFSRIVNLRTGETVIFKFKPLTVKSATATKTIVKSWEVQKVLKPKVKPKAKAAAPKQVLRLEGKSPKVKTKVKQVRKTYNRVLNKYATLKKIKVISAVSRFAAVGLALGRLNKFRIALLPSQQINLDNAISIIERIIDRQIPVQKPIPATKIGITPIQKIKPATKQKPSTRQISKTAPKVVRKVKKTPPKPKTPRITTKIKLPKLPKVQKFDPNKPYNVYVKRRNSWVKFGKPVKGSDAIRLGRWVVNNHIAATYVIRRSTAKKVTKIAKRLTAPAKGFRTPKKTSRLPKLAEVEKRAFRLNTRGETRQITLAKLQKKAFPKKKAKKTTKRTKKRVMRRKK